jgi:hypothetical protein
MTRAAQDDIVIKKGRKWSISWTFTDSDGVALNLSTYTFQGQIRASADPTSTLIATFSFDTTNAATGVIVASIDDSTSTITADNGYFDVVAIDASSKPWTYIYGYAKFEDSPTVVV